MSVLDLPRIHFKGTCRVDAATGNNDDVRINIDAVNTRLGPNLDAMSDDDARAWMMGGIRARHPFNGKVFHYLKSGWNYFGTMHFSFVQASVVAVTDEAGVTRKDDPLVGQVVEIQGTPGHGTPARPTLPVICDLDPTNAITSQVFLGRFLLGDAGLGLEGMRDVRAFSRWIHWRNVTVYQGEQNYPNFGATLQFAMPNKVLSFQGTGQSPVLDALCRAASAARGIVVQFAIFQPEPRLGDEELMARFARGKFIRNPVETLMVGTVGVWNEGELETAPADRLLLRAYPTIAGPATAKLQRGRDVISLNLVSTFPEANFCRPPSKYDFGPVCLGLIRPTGGPPVVIGGPIPYDYETYEQSGGIVDVPVHPGAATRRQIECGTLMLLFHDGISPYPVPLVSEHGSTITVESDDRGVYLDVGETGDIYLLVRERGRPPCSDVRVSLWEYQTVLDPGEDQQRASYRLVRVTRDSGLASRVEIPPAVTFPRGRCEPLKVPVRARTPGAAILALTLDGKPPGGAALRETTPFAGVRVLPDDDFSEICPEVRLSWDFVYRTIWRFYHIVFPVMSQVLPMNDQEAMENAAPRLVALSDPALRGTTHYMPTSRDLSRGKRALLVEWAQEVERRRHPPA